MIEVTVTNRQTRFAFDASRLSRAVEIAMSDANRTEGEVNVAIVDDEEIRELHSRFLSEDSATDVLSFPLGPPGVDSRHRCDGEIVVSADTADVNARRFGWTRDDELLLYVVHGVLHLVGYDDVSSAELARMRMQEKAVLAKFGVAPNYLDGRGAHANEPDGGVLDDTDGGPPA